MASSTASNTSSVEGSNVTPASAADTIYAIDRVGEKAVLAAVPSAVVLRPSIMFGPEDDFFNRFATLARMSQERV